MSGNLILCYCAAVKKQLHPETLTQALNHLILYHEMLQARLESGKYVLEPEAHARQSDELLSIYDCAGKSTAEVETLMGQIVENLAGTMRCERGESVRAAYLRLDKDLNKLLLLSHRAVIDPRGLVLIFEDLYRIYEQLSNGKTVALRRVQKTYTEFIKEAAVTEKTESLAFSGQFAPGHGESIAFNSNGRTEADQRKTAAFSIIFDGTLKRRLFSWRLAEFELAPVAALAGALLRSLAKAGEGDSVNIFIKSDYRLTDEMLMRTVGAMTRTHMLRSDFAEERELFSNVKKLRGILRDIPLWRSPQDAKSLNTGKQLRLNLEYLTDEPWLGGDEWLPQGFIMPGKDRLGGNYSIEVMPAIFSDRIEIFTKYEETPEVRMLVDKFAANLAPELEIILRYCEGYVDAKEFWVREFAKATTQSKIEVESDGRPVTGKGRASLACRGERSVIDRALLNVEADEPQLLLAAYSVLASRLSGREDLVLLCTLDQGGVNAVFPLRLNPVWTSSFKLFVEQVKGKLRRAAAMGQYAFDILIEEQPKHCWPYLVPDIGYVCRQKPVEKGVERPTAGLPSGSQLPDQEPDLVLEISGRDGDLYARFDYETSRFSEKIIKRFGVYLNTILEDVAADANVKLGDVEFEKDQKVYDAASTLAQDAFKF